MVWVLGAALAAGVTGDPRVTAASVLIFGWWMRGADLCRGGAAAVAVTGLAFGIYSHASISGFRRNIERVGAAAARSEGSSVEGWVCGFPAYRYGGMAFDFRTRIEGVECVVRVRSKEFLVSYGDSLRVDGKWRFPGAGAQPHERRLIAQGVCGDFRALPGGARRLEGKGGDWLTREVLSPCHEKVREELSRGLGARSGFPIAVLLGETGYLDRRLGDAFTELGITHLIALSGQHLCFIAGVVLVLLRCLRRRSTAALLLAISLYVGVVGFIVSLWRAFVMAMVLALAGSCRRPIDPVKALGEAFVIVLLFFPHAYYSVGFQLSFLATLALLLAVRGLRAPASRSWARRAWFGIRSSLCVSVAAQLAVTPVLIHYFDRVSVLAPAATLVYTLPVAFVLLYSGFAAGAAAVVPPAGPVLFAVLDRAVGFLDRSVTYCAAMVPGTVSPPAPEPYLYYGGLWLVAFAKGKRRRRAAGWSLLAISFGVGVLRGQVS
jgi:competence protein ComEC